MRRAGGIDRRRAAPSLISLAASSLVAVATTTWPLRAAPYDSKTSSFALAFNGEVSAYREMSLFVLPESTIVLQAVGGPPGDYALSTKEGAVTLADARRWRWRAPAEPGLYNLRIAGPSEEESITVHAFVLVPASRVKDGMLNGYRIGEYPPKAPDGNPIYDRPAGFVEVTKENQNTRLTPHFTLKQFICKEDTTSEFPKYVVVKERLLLKLEAVVELVNMMGFHVDTLHVMSAYRTPYYNHAIGDVQYSMHQWGSAADVYVDRDNKGRMDDLTGDGRVDVEDARFLYDAIERLVAEPRHKNLEGGLGFYPATSAHPPFVHLDVRGTKARWRG